MRRIHRVLRSIGTRVLDTLLPPCCPVTGALVDQPGMLSPECWQGIVFISDNCCARCGLPFELQEGPNAVCGRCLENPPVFSSARCAVEYNGTSRHLILSFKHADQTHAVLSFVPWMMQCSRNLRQGVDIVVPVPLHKKRLWRRRYNQSALLAHELAKRTGLKVHANILVRSRYTRPQGGLNRHERQKNVHNAFALRSGSEPLVKNRTVLLVDDVFTTGATLNECARVLLQAGAKDVRCLCVARVAQGSIKQAASLENLAA